MVCANTTALPVFKVSVAIIKNIPKIAIRKVILNLLVELKVLLLFLFFHLIAVIRSCINALIWIDVRYKAIL